MTTPLNTIFTESAVAYLRVIEGISFMGNINGTLALDQFSGTLYTTTACRKMSRSLSSRGGCAGIEDDDQWT